MTTNNAQATTEEMPKIPVLIIKFYLDLNTKDLCCQIMAPDGFFSKEDIDLIFPPRHRETIVFKLITTLTAKKMNAEKEQEGTKWHKHR